MATWQVTVSGKGLRKAAVEKLVKRMETEFGDGASVTVRDASPPESRADRFGAAQSLVSDARSQAEELRDELQEWHDNLPEAFQSGSKGDEIQEAIDALDEFIGNAEELEGHDVSFPGMY